MKKVAIMGNGPRDHIPSLKQYEKNIDLWVGVDKGALYLLEQGISVDYGIGDFDSVNDQEKEKIIEHVKNIETHPEEKDATDLELALHFALNLQPEKIYLFGVTGGRLDHTLLNLQLLLHPLQEKRNISATMIDPWNKVEMIKPGITIVEKEEKYPYISFISFTNQVKNLSLEGFYYPLSKQNISWGSSLCLSNKLTENQGEISFSDGLLVMVKSRDKL